ncbi:Plug domain-containing protein, partial [Escherichia coli]|nr:Plug domain-containing protein [Escherichia coli]
AALTAAGLYSPAFAEDQIVAVALPTAEVVGSTPIDSIGVPLSQFPANAQRVSAKDAREQRNSNLADLLNDNLGQVSISNGSGNPYQNDINYRGFQVSSLLGVPIGVSVYFDGVRMNEPFGSIVNWDLIPMNAMSSVNILPGSNPMFGLNT